MKILSSQEFKTEVLGSTKPVVVDFFATWCMPCRMLAPIVDELAKDWAGKVDFVKVDIDKCPDLATNYAIMSVPTLMLFNGGKAIDAVVGVMPKNAIERQFGSRI